LYSLEIESVTRDAAAILNKYNTLDASVTTLGSCAHN
jgi:hypothetical protein